VGAETDVSRRGPLIAAPVATEVREAALPPSRAAAQPLPVAVRNPAPRAALRPAIATRPLGQGGSYVVQLGAFSNQKAAQGAWNRLAGRFSLANYDVVGGNAKSRNATLVRVAVGGFGTRDDANRVCARIRQGGGACFVRNQQGDAPAQWVQKQTYRVAAR
jgi:cell division septation protein DedD